MYFLSIPISYMSLSALHFLVFCLCPFASSSLYLSRCVVRVGVWYGFDFAAMTTIDEDEPIVWCIIFHSICVCDITSVYHIVRSSLHQKLYSSSSGSSGSLFLVGVTTTAVFIFRLQQCLSLVPLTRPTS